MQGPPTTPASRIFYSPFVICKNIKTEKNETVILLVLYGCETWFLTLREGHGLRVSDNRVLRTVFGPKRAEVTGDWRKSRNEERHDRLSSPNIIRVIKSRKMRLTGHVVSPV
jgi:hypothetical protein